MTFIEAIKNAKPGQIIQNKEECFSLIVLVNNKIKVIDSMDGSLCEEELNDTKWEITDEI